VNKLFQLWNETNGSHFKGAGLELPVVEFQPLVLNTLNQHFFTSPSQPLLDGIVGLHENFPTEAIS
jgi:hypothetical protein